ncbi:MAG: class I tRNA ligase family protein, partial [Acidobacteria bacterium]|nr:class I tRNA ligase family protein [Acidobacteriota bacterium]
FRGEVPFHEVYFNGLVRDARGEKMSKTRGNVIDPIDVIDQYGADAVRFTLAILAVPGTEIPLAPDRMAGYRTFVNKIWNASRFVLMKIPAGEQPALPPRARLGLAERWILSRVNQVSRQVKEALEQYRFDEAANQLYHFVWHEFCDWYVEFSKLSLPAGEDGEENPPARWVLVEVLGRLLRLLHPFMPFVTEELWQKLPPPRDSIMVSAFPEFRKREVDEKAEEKMKLLIQVITKIRNIRAETRIDPSRKVFLLMKVEGKAERRLLEEQEKAVLRLTRAAELTFTDQFETDLVAARGGLPGIEFAIPLAGILDIDAERGRLSREKEKVETDLKNTFRKLNNDGFLNNAPPEIVAKVQKEHRQLIERRTRLEENLKQLVP